MCSEAVGGRNYTKCEGRNKKQAEHLRFTSTVSCWFVGNMTSGCGCGEQMIQTLCAACSVMTTMFLHIHAA